MADSFNSEMYVPPISTMPALEHVVCNARLFPTEEGLRYVLGRIQEAGLCTGRDGELRFHISIKKLLSMIGMARQEPEEIAERLGGALVGLGM